MIHSFNPRSICTEVELGIRLGFLILSAHGTVISLATAASVVKDLCMTA